MREKTRRDARLAQALLELCSGGMAVVDAEGRILHHSERFAELLGAERRVVGRWLGDLLHPEDRARTREAVREIRDNPGSLRQVRCLAAGASAPLELLLHDRLADRVVGGIVIEVRPLADVRALELKLKHAAYRDPLTGLRNRVAFLDRVRIAAPPVATARWPR